MNRNFEDICPCLECLVASMCKSRFPTKEENSERIFRALNKLPLDGLYRATEDSCPLITKWFNTRF